MILIWSNLAMTFICFKWEIVYINASLPKLYCLISHQNGMTLPIEKKLQQKVKEKKKEYNSIDRQELNNNYTK
jgi:hypothetical protein